MFKQAKELLYTSVTEVWRGRMECLDMALMLLEASGVMGVEVVNSTIEQERATMICFARVQFFIENGDWVI